MRFSNRDVGDPIRQFQNFSGVLVGKTGSGCLGEEAEAANANFFKTFSFDNKGKWLKVRRWV